LNQALIAFCVGKNPVDEFCKVFCRGREWQKMAVDTVFDK